MSGRPPINIIIGVVALGVGCILHIVGLATPQWSYAARNGARGSLGLWKICGDSECYAYSGDKSDNLMAAEAFAIIGILFGGGAAALALFNLLITITKRTPIKLMPLLSLAASTVAFAAIEVGAAIWAAGINSLLGFDLGYSFGLSVAGGILIGLGGFIGLTGSLHTVG